jgi:tetratricopeptide (TPR) repeat protein
MKETIDSVPFERPPLDRVNLALGWGIFLFTLVIYTLTRSATVPFWDCGEFIACSYTLGVPHPPGTPLFVLIGRVFSMIPGFIVGDISARVNWLSGVCSAGAAMVGYFVLARLITAWKSDTYTPQRLSVFPRLAVYAGSVAGALFLAFSDTNWGNAVEAEVYGAAMFLLMTLIWLSLVWYERRQDHRSDKYLIALSYIAILSLGIHMTTFLAMFPIFFMALLASPRLRRDWRFWITGICLALVVGSVETFLLPTTIWLLAATCGHYWPHIRRGWVAVPLACILVGGFWSLNIGEWWPMYLMGYAASLVLFVVFRIMHEQRSWMLAHLIILAGLTGYTVQGYIPLRTAHDPVLDMNDPETWQTFKGFLERKQYGQESMFERALTRRGEWANQFGQHRRMGFWGFFDQQYGYNDTAFLPFFVLGLFGLAAAVRNKWKQGLTVFLILLLSSVGLIWYMNFADGTRYNPSRQDAYLEVRDRDYFFTPAFMLFGLAMGLGVASLVGFLGKSIEEARVARPLRYAALGLGGALALLPLKTLAVNYHPNDKSNDYIPWDYAYNILQTADENAVLFTNGDNDTFPVWCLQQVYGIRPDVKVTNLSLINTQWYIKQLKNKLGVPISFSDEQIDRLAHVMTPEGEIYRLQDRMIDDIITTNRWNLPVNFAVTVPESNRRYQGEGLDDHLKMIGMGFRVVPETGKDMVDTTLMHEKFWNVFQFRSIKDPDLYQTESDRRLITNYASGFLFIADAKRKAGDLAGAVREARKAMEVLPDEWQPYVYLAQLAVDLRSTETLETLMEKALASRADMAQVVPNVYYSYERLDRRTLGQGMLRRVLEVYPHNEKAFKTLISSYHEERNYDTLIAALREWVRQNPADTQSARMLFDLEAQLSTTDLDDTAGDSTPRKEDLPGDTN